MASFNMHQKYFTLQMLDFNRISIKWAVVKEKTSSVYFTHLCVRKHFQHVRNDGCDLRFQRKMERRHRLPLLSSNLPLRLLGIARCDDGWSLEAFWL